MKNNSLFKYSKDRPWYINACYMLVAFLGMFLIPALFLILLRRYIHNDRICTILADLLFIGVLYLMYYKDLNDEAKIYFKDFKNKFKQSFKIYLIGFFGMVFFNMVIVMFLGEISSNENQVREMLYHNVLTTMISISIIAPIMEELIFRKSLQPLIKDKWIYVIICGLLFGGAHILTNILNNDFVWLDLFYILPYAALGCSFAFMDYESKTTFSSIMIHAFHNTCTAILLLALYFAGGK